MTKLLSLLLSFSMILGSARLAVAQTTDTHTSTTSTTTTPPVSSDSGGSFQLSVPLLQGRPAPFTGLLITESSATQCIEDSASVDRLTVDLAARTRELDLSSSLRDQFISDQRDRIQQLSQHSWWDDNGNVFMLGLGVILGIAAAALIAGLVHN
jgi:hypothetical protein